MAEVDALLGAIETIDPGAIAGWACMRRPDGSERPAILELLADDVLVFRFVASAVREDVRARGACGIARTGFRLDHAFPVGTRIALQSAETGARLGTPRHVAPSRPPRIGLIAPARDEAPFLLEWLAYHRTRGIERFFIADNGGTDATSDLLCRLDRAGLVTRYDYLGRSYFQTDFYAETLARPEVRAACDLLAALDCDEFLVATNGRPIPATLAELFADDAVSALALNWANYGSAGQEEHDPARLVLEQYDRRAEERNPLNNHIKSVFRPERFRGFRVNVHAIDMDYGLYRAASGDAADWDVAYAARGITRVPDWTNLRVNHYSTKSRSAFVQRKLQGRAADRATSEAMRRHADYFALHDTNDVREPADAAVIAETRAEIARIEALIAAA
ncbi:glycosyltransferase family 2 protein [Methylobacterium radiodurans]|uniref:Glycosyl transferase family 2 n=1 Tax=Methylobacterium radiodurans TaxID=2202828 RepID=A0A2U8VUT8_9HYPH|nr:glycosyltransferase family 2 protein [Methylobacterium radiodurans]AWN37543.1 hypothetical protein DK427_18905 [Methylobacterium radiodurans]